MRALRRRNQPGAGEEAGQRDNRAGGREPWSAAAGNPRHRERGWHDPEHEHRAEPPEGAHEFKVVRDHGHGLLELGVAVDLAEQGVMASPSIGTGARTASRIRTTSRTSSPDHHRVPAHRMDQPDPNPTSRRPPLRRADQQALGSEQPAPYPLPDSVDNGARSAAAAATTRSCSAWYGAYSAGTGRFGP